MVIKYIPHSRSLYVLRQNFFANQTVLLLEEMFAIYEYHVHDKIHRRYMDPKICASFNFCQCIPDHKIKDPSPLMTQLQDDIIEQASNLMMISVING